MRSFLRVSALLGALTWTAYAVLHEPFAFGSLFLAAPLVLVPLALVLVLTPDRRGRLPRLYRLAATLQPPAALGVLAAFLQPPGVLAATLATPWLLLTGVLALHGGTRLLTRGRGPIEELAIDAALLYAPIGGAWLAASRLGIEPLGFGEPVVLLTAVHFHFAATLILTLAGAIGRAAMPSAAEPFYHSAVAALIAGPILLALGITFSHVLEIAAALVLAAGVLLLLFVAATWRPVFLVAALAAGASMSAALLFAVRGADLAWMARVHGAVNLGVLAFGLVAMQMIPAVGRGPRTGLPMSTLRSHKWTGPDFFERIGAIDPRPHPPTGLVDDLSSYRRPDFDPDLVAPAIRRFYERTQDHDLVVVPTWARGFRTLGRLYLRYAAKVGQMRFPPPGGSGQRIRSVIVPVRDAIDGRTNVRAWVRTYVATGEPVYVAAYSTHDERGQTYMNIAFPFPAWNLTSVLRLEELPEGAVLLTSRATARTWGDQGVYAVGRRWRVRLPIDETIRVWSDDGTRVLARHVMWFWGVRFLALDYTISVSADRAVGV